MEHRAVRQGLCGGTALYTMLCLSLVVPGLLSRLLHYAWPQVTTPCAVAQRLSPSLAHSAEFPACPRLPFLGAPPFLDYTQVPYQFTLEAPQLVDGHVCVN